MIFEYERGYFGELSKIMAKFQKNMSQICTISVDFSC